MLIKLKNKDTLIIDDFKLKCCIGKRGVKSKKKEGDLTTPRGVFKLGPVYYRNDRVPKPVTKLKCYKIKKNMGWCNDVNSKYYNRKIIIKKKIKHEKMFRKDYKYDYVILINYNYQNPIINKGSAIFLHLTNNYKPTLGCIALKKKDLLILLKIAKRNTKIKIN
tara:strand:- start:592 stop:1083 length:492 start_codon:yes stop_codon:yes gene_type:complete